MGSLSRSVPPQVGMLHFDKEWREELTMLRLAIQHINRLNPRFLFVSGDLINAFPCARKPALSNTTSDHIALL